MDRHLPRTRSKSDAVFLCLANNQLFFGNQMTTKLFGVHYGRGFLRGPGAASMIHKKRPCAAAELRAGLGQDARNNFEPFPQQDLGLGFELVGIKIEERAPF